jgi:hypothetical protein
MNLGRHDHWVRVTEARGGDRGLFMYNPKPVISKSEPLELGRSRFALSGHDGLLKPRFIILHQGIDAIIERTPGYDICIKPVNNKKALPVITSKYSPYSPHMDSLTPLPPLQPRSTNRQGAAPARLCR